MRNVLQQSGQGDPASPEGSENRGATGAVGEHPASQMHMPYKERAAVGRLAKIAVALIASTVIAAALAAVLVEAYSISPRLLGTYVERRASGHSYGIGAIGRTVNRLLLRLDRGELEPRLQYPDWIHVGPVQQSGSEAPVASGREVMVASESDLQRALSAAEPGDRVVLAPGRYRFSGRALTANRPGLPNAPIIVTALPTGSAVLEFDMVEGFHVSAPHWIFQNLVIRGVCDRNDACEHAFHVVGAARRVVIRNNDVRDFNAHVKINGDREAFPDGGRLEGNVFVNGQARNTANPVTPVDLVAASDWVVSGNLIADFIKGAGDQTSYGMFAKGGGARTVSPATSCCANTGCGECPGAGSGCRSAAVDRGPRPVATGAASSSISAASWTTM